MKTGVAALFLGGFLVFTPHAASAQAPRASATAQAGSDRVITATRITKPLAIDGRFDDEAYTTVQPWGDFIQQDPREGQPATERTDLWVMFDDTYLYLAGKCYDSHPEREISTELRHDSSQIFQNDSIAVVIDTLDRKSVV